MCKTTENLDGKKVTDNKLFIPVDKGNIVSENFQLVELFGKYCTKKVKNLIMTQLSMLWKQLKNNLA